MANAPPVGKFGDPPAYTETNIEPFGQQPGGAYPVLTPVHQPGAPMYPSGLGNAQVPPVTSVVIGGMNNLPPGTCTVCRIGQMQDSASCCTWFWCCMLVPCGIIPGIIAFCCCCRKPKCSHCGYTV